MPRQLWIADKCREFKLPTVEEPGWKTRGSEVFNPKVFVEHHTADGPGDLPSLHLVEDTGRLGIPPPLANVMLSRSGAVHVIAAGRANHAGRGGWHGMVGNSAAIGCEAESRGVGDWTQEQRHNYPILAAAMIDGMKSTIDMICGHKEWAPTRKIDPVGIDMNQQRYWAGIVLLAHRGGVIPQEDDMQPITIEHPMHGFTIIHPEDGHVTNHADARPGGAPYYRGGMNVNHEMIRAHHLVKGIFPNGGYYYKEMGVRPGVTRLRTGETRDWFSLVITYSDGRFYTFPSDKSGM